MSAHGIDPSLFTFPQKHEDASGVVDGASFLTDLTAAGQDRRWPPPTILLVANVYLVAGDPTFRVEHLTSGLGNCYFVVVEENELVDAVAKLGWQPR